MELRQLKYFLKVAETLNFSVASKELFITQSTLSQQILNLERELDQQLFLRNSHEVLLTEAGQILVPMVRESLHNVDTLLLRLGELKNLMCGELNIGVTFSFSSMIAETVIDFQKRYPQVKLNVCYSSMADLIGRLRNHELDLVLAFKPNHQDEHVESQVLFVGRLAAVVNERHPLARKQSITLQELSHYCLALPAIGMQARNSFEKLLEKANLQLKVRTEMNNVGLLFKIVRQSNYVTILSEATVIDETGLRAIPIDAPENHMEGCIHTLRDSYTKNSAREFILMLNQCTAILKNSVLQGF